MATVIRPEISEKNKYYINKHRHYELKHFCLQYKEWKKAYASCCESVIFGSKFERMGASNMPSDLTAKYATLRAQYAEKIALVEEAAFEADPVLYKYILRAVTEGLSYPYLKTNMDIPCGKDMYYDRYRRFFWILNNKRG
jgi:hypothetical protein